MAGRANIWLRRAFLSHGVNSQREQLLLARVGQLLFLALQQCQARPLCSRFHDVTIFIQRRTIASLCALQQSNFVLSSTVQ